MANACEQVNKPKLLVVRTCPTFRQCYAEGSRKAGRNRCEFDFVTFGAYCQPRYLGQHHSIRSSNFRPNPKGGGGAFSIYCC